MITDIKHLVTIYDAKRAERLAADKVATELASEEQALKQQLINAMKDANLTVVGTTKVQFTLRIKERSQVVDWASLYRFIADNEAWDMLQRRINESAIEERISSGIQVPGVEKYSYDELSRPTKVKT